MAIGEYTATSWAFEALVESVKLDQMAENNNNMVRAGRSIYTSHMTTGSYEWDNMRGESGETHLFEIDPLEIILFLSSWFTVYLADKGAYDKLYVPFYVCDIENPDPDYPAISTLQTVDLPDDCSNPKETDTFDVTTTGLWAHTIDISSYDPGTYRMLWELYIVLTDRMTTSGISAFLTRTGLGT